MAGPSLAALVTNSTVRGVPPASFPGIVYLAWLWGAERYPDAGWRRRLHAEAEYRTSPGRWRENGYVAGIDASYDLGNDLVTAISGGLKIKF